MNRTKKLAMLLGVTALSSVAFATPNYASLVTFKNYTGNVGLSTDGFGSTDQVGVISASAPAGSTVLAAYLYSATFDSGPTLSGVTLNGVNVNFTATAPNATACCSLSSYRADVTSLVAGIINGGAGGVYNFTVDEGTNFNVDGEALVVIYSNPALSVSTIGILDGFASVDGDTTSITFAQPLDPTAPGFVADMILGIGFSCCDDQRSTVEVNGTLLTENAGNNDDGVGGLSNGQLITVGSFDDPYSPNLPSYGDDREKYDLKSFLKKGDTSITINTFNSSADDNIFLAAFQVTGEAKIGPSPVPLPAGVWLLGTAIAALGFGKKRRKSAKSSA
jgi:uncharacterized protein (UPF0333 family)